MARKQLNPILGYAVTGNDAYELANYSDGPAGGIMLSGDHVSLFSTRRAANQAIKRTRQYEQENGLDWDTKFLTVLAVRKPDKSF